MDYLDDKSIEISDIDQIAEKLMMITYKVKNEFISEHPSSNIVIIYLNFSQNIKIQILSLWTTSFARTRLYHHMKAVSLTRDAEIVYYDTGKILSVFKKCCNFEIKIH